MVPNPDAGYFQDATYEDMLPIRDLVMCDLVAQEKWLQVVDSIVALEDQRSVKFALKSDFTDGVLVSLHTWLSYGAQRRKNLLEVLGERPLGLYQLVEKIKNVRMGFKENSPHLWFRVDDEVHNFTGRRNELLELHEKFSASAGKGSSKARIVSISGLGGIGKSALARAYAHRYNSSYDGNVLWINAKSQHTIREYFIRLMTELHLEIDHQASNEELAEKVYERFNGLKSLFIFDDVQEWEHLEQFRFKTTSFPNPRPSILMTSRQRDLNPVPANRLHLRELKPEEALQLIVAHFQDDYTYDTEQLRERATQLAEALHRLPVALQQAIVYIMRRILNHDIAEYLNRLGEFEAERQLLEDETFLSGPSGVDDYHLTTLNVWNGTLSQIGGQAVRLIRVLSYLDPDHITMPFLRVLDVVELQTGLNNLERFSMTNCTHGEVVGINTVLQRVTRLNLRDQPEHASIMGVLVQILQNEPLAMPREYGLHALHLFPFQRRYAGILTTEAKRIPVYLFKLCSRLAQDAELCQRSLEISRKSVHVFQKELGRAHEHTIRMSLLTAETHCVLSEHRSAMTILEMIQGISKEELGFEHELTKSIEYLMSETCVAMIAICRK